MEKTKKIFLCHSSKDKDRFVRNFARRLWKKGIEVWIDEDQILLGDDLDRRIFGDGFENMDAFILVLSKNSIASDWVRRELDKALALTREGMCRLIPVLIDDCDIPDTLENKARATIKDVNSYNEDFDKIVLSIYGRSPTHTFGEKPSYVNFQERIFGLESTDSALLKVIFEASYDKKTPFIRIDLLLAWSDSVGLPHEELYDSLSILEEEGFIELESILGPSRFAGVMIRGRGLVRCLQGFLKDYIPVRQRIIAELANRTGGISHSLAIADKLRVEHFLVEGVLVDLEYQGLISIKRSNMDTLVSKVSPKLKRHLEN